LCGTDTTTSAVGAEHDRRDPYASDARPDRIVDHGVDPMLDLVDDAPGHRVDPDRLRDPCDEAALERLLERLDAEDVQEHEAQDRHVGEPERGEAVEGGRRSSADRR
jgi:hypothetical protein